MSVNEGAGSATPTRDTQKNADIVRRQAISDLTVLARQFEDASKRWPNLTSVLVTWSESAPAFDAEWLPDDLQPQYAVPVPAPAGELHYVALAIGDCRLDSPARRFRPGSAGMMILRRSFGVMGDRADTRDPSDAVAVADRWHALTDQLMPVWYETSKVDPSPEGDRLWNPRWRLILHGEVESRHLVVRSVYQVSVVNDLFLASSILIHRRINEQQGSVELDWGHHRWQKPDEPQSVGHPTRPPDARWSKPVQLGQIAAILKCEAKARTVGPKLKALGSELECVEPAGYRVLLNGLNGTLRDAFEKL